MNNQTQEALKMAIEALQNNQTYDWKGNPLTALDEANEKVINACKEALASHSEALDTKQVCENAAPAQEPVAWMLFKHGKKDSIHFNNPVDFNAPKEWWVENGYQSIPLYTHPAQPLSGIEVLDLFTELFGVNGTQAYAYFDPVKFARAIEQAHGIGVKDADQR